MGVSRPQLPGDELTVTQLDVHRDHQDPRSDDDSPSDFHLALACPPATCMIGLLHNRIFPALARRHTVELRTLQRRAQAVQVLHL